MAAAGWYEDPQYEGWERYFDGKSWTDHRRPTPTPSWPAPVTRESAAAAAVDRSAAWTPPAVESSEPDDPNWWERPAGRQPAARDLPAAEPLGPPRPTDLPRNGQSPTATNRSAVGSPPAEPDERDAGTGAGRAATADRPSGTAATADRPSRTAADRPSPTVRSRSRRRRRSPLRALALIGLVIVLLAAATVVVIRHLSHPLTYDGRRITNPSQVLAQAGANVRAIVGQRHGVDNSSTRCYFVQPARPAPGTKTSDVGSTILCGPVLFVDGTIGQEYLRFGLHSTQTSNGEVTLTAAHTPVSDQPAALPRGYVLKRPDGLHPSRNSTLSVPPPPPAPANELISTSLGSQAVPPAPSNAIIGSLNGGLRLTNLGTVKRYGRFDNARSAPLGQTLIAFRLSTFIDNDGAFKSLLGSTTLSVNGGPGRHLPAATGPYYLVAVPASASSVNLVVTDAGYTQTLSLLTGQPGPHNLAVLTRGSRVAVLHQTKPVTFDFSPAIVGPHKKRQTSDTISVTVDSAALLFWAGPSQRPASSPSNAWLVPDYSYTDPDHPGQVFGLPSNVMTFTPHGGSPEPATNLAPGAGKTLNAFSVPATVTSGTLTISGSFSQPASNGHHTIKTTIPTPVSFTVTFPP